MLLTRVKEMRVMKRVKNKLEEGGIIEQFVHEKEKRIRQYNHLKRIKKERASQFILQFKFVHDVSPWEVNRKLKRLANIGISREDLRNGIIVLPLSKKKSSLLATPLEIESIENMIDDLEGFEELRLKYFYHYKPRYKEKKMFGEITRFLEIYIH